ncbi:MAG: hypothetical protein AB7P50_16180 [Alphaproteobacteria bacterium]
MTAQTTEHRYAWQAIRGDYIRAAIGFGLCGAAFLAAGWASWGGLVFGACALIFLAFAVRTALRQGTVIAVTDSGIASRYTFHSTLGRAEQPWDGLQSLKLRFYSTKRDRSAGWMQLKLSGASGRMSIDSTIDGFDAIARRTALAARANDVALNPATVSNLLALGIDLERPDGRSGWNLDDLGKAS